MNIEIKISNGKNLCGKTLVANVFIDGKWFKEVISEETNEFKFKVNVLQITIDDLKQDIK